MMVRTTSLFTLLIFLCLGCTKDSSDGAELVGKAGLCGTRARITNGQTCDDPGSTPVMLLRLAVDGPEIRGACSGTLITPDTILTAAHCVDSRMGVTKVFVDIDNRGKLVEVRQAVYHPAWDGVAGNPYDVGIVKLNEPITSRPTVPLILSRGVNPGDRIGIYGYGADEYGLAGVLKEGEMEITRLQDRLIVAEYDKTGMSICFGDSGGPATIESNGFTGIIGINSAAGISETTCLDGTIAVFADIQLQSNLEFILQHAPDVPGI